MVTLLQLHLVETDQEEESISNLIINNNENDYKNDNNQNVIQQNQDESSSPFLLLDIRNEEEFNKYHIKSAKQYDMLSLRRDKLGNDIYYFKNKSDKIIIICCNDENVGIKFSNELSKKYIDNIFLLTISVQRFCIKFPELCVGYQFPEKDINAIEPKARLHFVDWRPTTKQNKKIKHSLHSRQHSQPAMSTISTATSVRTWIP